MNTTAEIAEAIIMISGIGIDIVDISRIERIIKKPRFLERVFTESEQERFKTLDYLSQTVAGVFAAKEAVSKALGTGFSGFNTKDVEVLPDTDGTPRVILYNGAKQRFSYLGGAIMHVSISHERNHAIAMAVLECGQ